MRILALEPYYGGSHRSFLDGWIGQSRHSWTLLTLPPYKWKWRMRHSAVTFAAMVAEALEGSSCWDLLFCSDMLNLAEFLGLTPGAVRVLSCVVYFHENQLTYPVEHPSEFDYHFAFSNMTTALAAREGWFNSAYHRDSFLEELLSFLRRMPDHRPLEEVERIRAKSRVRYPGIGRFPVRSNREGGRPLRILWAARWEYDKDPETFFNALEILESEGVDFRLSVVGGGDGRNTLPVFERAREHFRGKIDHWGFRETRDEYAEVLAGADVVVSTANHEFFGISVVEAVAAGAYPLVPERLAYPEVLGGEEEGKASFFYDGGEKELAGRLIELAKRVEKGGLWEGDPSRGVRAVERFSWDTLAPEYDEALSRLTNRAD